MNSSNENLNYEQIVPTNQGKNGSLFNDDLSAQLQQRERLLDEEDINEVFTPKVKNRTIIAILVQLLIGNMMVNNLVAFLPTYVEDFRNSSFLGV